MQTTTPAAPSGRHLSTKENDQLRRLLTAKGLWGPDLEDALQEVNLRVLRHAPGEGPLLPWATRVAINAAMDHHRRQRRARQLDERLARVVSPRSVDPDVAQRATVATALAELRPEHRDVVRLHLLADLTVPETARRLALAEGTVKSRLHRGLAQLRRRLGVSPGQGPRGPPMGAAQLWPRQEERAELPRP